MGILTLLYDNSSGVFSKTMPAYLKTTLLLAIITVCSADSDFGGPYSSNDRFLLKKISEIYQAKRENSFKQAGRRQLDFGGDSRNESWTGRWFPETVTEDPKISNGEIDSRNESWTGRWFPETVTEDPKTSFNDETDSRNESWTGRWFPETVTEDPETSSNGETESRNESWTGRWFPETVTEDPKIFSNGEISPEDWTGRWFPEKVTERPLSPALLPAFEGMPADISMWKMINSTCDDGKTNLTVDWSGSPINYTCFNPQRYFLPDYNLPNIIMKSLIPKAYKAKHECMQKEIHYSKDLPTFGTHRPAWPRYGEYKFVPRQRWLHSLEHGAIVFLYHPCAHPQLVNELRELVTGCLFRHIITPYTLLPPERPFALVSWGWALLMSAPDEPGAIEFIKKHALQGPELTAADGQFSEGLIQPAVILSDAEDSAVCPNQLF